MSVPQHLRVIGSRRIYQFFLPSTEDPSLAAEFLLVNPEQATTAFSEIPNDGALTLLVNPDDYEVADINALPGPTCLWFLRRLAPGKQEIYDDSPRLFSAAQQEIRHRVRFFESLVAMGNASVVVSDPASHEFCWSSGVRAVLSPPPVSDGLTRSWRPATVMSLAWWADHGPYASKFQDFMGTEYFQDGENNVSNVARLTDITHSVIIRESVVREFPYEVAVCLSAGHTVVCEAMDPLWGLEPGIDFFELTTPEELHHAVEAFRRSPSLSSLMSRRGQAKARNFASSRVLSRVFSSR